VSDELAGRRHRTVAQDIESMQHGEQRTYSHAAGQFNVRYEAEQAMGDNGLPARGYTVGHFHVTDPSGAVTSFRHTPHGPTLTGAKGYAAGQAAQMITSPLFAHIFNDRRKS
jgi:NADPH-dependent ferric siderophore reductase